MNISLYKTNSEKNVVYKTLTNEVSFADVTFKNPTEILNPVITLSTNIDVEAYNYCYIPEFNRYYYISNIVSVVNGLWTINLSVDVLMSFKQYFAKFDVILKRSQTEYNKYINDGEIVTTADNIISTIKFPQTPLNKQMYFILTTVGGV